MADERDPALTTSVRYMDRSRDFYAAQGYERPYRWAHHDDAPFASMAGPLADARIGVVTTTARHRDDIDPDAASSASGAAFAAPADPPPDRMHTDHLEWDREATHTDDVETFLPLRRLTELAEEGRIGSTSPRYYGVPTVYSHRRTERNAELVETWCREDDVDAVLLVPL
jgi:hypothetical protein